MKRKILAGMMSVMMVVGMGMSVGAETEGTAGTATNPSTGMVTMTAEVPSSFTLSIPASSVSLTNGNASTVNVGEFSVKGNVDVDETVSVAISGTNDNHLERTGSTSDLIPFDLKDITDTKNEKAYVTTEWDENTLRSGLSGAATKKTVGVSVSSTAWDEAKAGSYTATLTFTASLN